MAEFWETAFTEKRLMWGLAPTKAASIAREYFIQQGAKNILIPGAGYGRNAKVFLDSHMSVTGIEISETAVELARTHCVPALKLYHGSVTDMPYDQQRYDGVFCHGLLYLLDAAGRAKLIHDCFEQLNPGGPMFFTLIAKDAPMYGRGQRLGEDWYEVMPGVPMFFYDADTVARDFSDYGLVEQSRIDEPASHGHTQPFIMVRCVKG